MSLKQFKHYNMTSLDQVSSIIAKHNGNASVIAGGTDLLGTMKDRIHPEYPKAILDIKAIPDLAYIKESDKGLSIGALTELHEIVKNKAIREKYNLLAEAAHSVASPQIRNVATIGGNICQEPRCWYYRNPDNKFYCLRKGGKICNALTGENQYHSIFGAARVGDTPCSSNCRGNVNIPSYLSKIREGKLVEAAEILLERNPIPAITGRVCPHYCEQGCNRGEFDEPVSIRAIERFLGDYILEHADEIINPPEINSGKSVAIVGSGPAGLSAAFYLRKTGHKVVVFEKLQKPGGILTYGIPTYRLSKDIVNKQIGVLKSIGVEFRTNIQVGTEITLESLKKNFNSIFLATGAWEQRSLDIEDADLLISGLEYLINVNSGVRKAPGKKVLVIGGGNVAIDVAVTTLRLGVKDVTMACLESREEMPAIASEIEQALEEGVKLMTSWGPLRILKTNRKVSGMELLRCSSVYDGEGHFYPTYDNNITSIVEADSIILAIGQKADTSFINTAVQIERGLIKAKKNTQATNIPGCFAGGDVVSGTASVIEAIMAGRRASISINQYINNRKVTAVGSKNREMTEPLLEFDNNNLTKTSRVQVPELPISKRSLDVEDVLSLDSKDVVTEANRCFNCGCVAVNSSDIASALIALDAKIKTTKRIIEAETFFTVLPMKSMVLEPDELVIEIQIPTPKINSKQIYLKFRLRNSIDFPIIGISMVICTNSKGIDHARVALGAVAPIPLRVREAEEFLMGKEINDEVAEVAASIVVRGAIPLAKNRYKVQVAKALFRRAILKAGPISI